MTTDEINKYIHGEIMGKCVVKVDPDSAGRCSRCGKRAIKNHEPPDYCSDASPRSLLNEVVAKVDESRLAREIDYAIAFHSDSPVKPKTFETYLPTAVKLTADQIARACVEAHKSEEDKPNGDA